MVEVRACLLRDGMKIRELSTTEQRSKFSLPIQAYSTVAF